jgi:hypothetical protein
MDRAVGGTANALFLPRITLRRLVLLVAVLAVYFAWWRATWVHSQNRLPPSSFEWSVRTSRIPVPGLIVNTEQEWRFDSAAEVRIYAWLGGANMLLYSYPVAPIEKDYSTPLGDILANETRALNQQRAAGTGDVE